MHPTLADALMKWRKRCIYIKPEDWVFASYSAIGAEDHTGDKRSCVNTYAQRRNEPVFQKRFWMAYVPAHLLEIGANSLEQNGGDDETRTRDLCRDSAHFLVTA